MNWLIVTDLGGHKMIVPAEKISYIDPDRSVHEGGAVIHLEKTVLKVRETVAEIIDIIRSGSN